MGLDEIFLQYEYLTFYIYQLLIDLNALLCIIETEQIQRIHHYSESSYHSSTSVRKIIQTDKLRKVLINNASTVHDHNYLTLKK